MGPVLASVRDELWCFELRVTWVARGRAVPTDLVTDETTTDEDSIQLKDLGGRVRAPAASAGGYGQVSHGDVEH